MLRFRRTGALPSEIDFARGVCVSKALMDVHGAPVVNCAVVRMEEVKEVVRSSRPHHGGTVPSSLPPSSQLRNLLQARRGRPQVRYKRIPHGRN